MKIKEMKASFGGLDHKILRPGPGLNLIYGLNEGGKSTWSAFLRAMLYGIPTRERDRQGHLAEKNRYQPWNGTAMEGTLTLESRGRDITLRRGPRGNTPFGSFEAVYTATGEPVPGLTGETAGEVLVGAPREVFERSAFVGQGCTAIDGAPALEARIAALASSGEEDVSASQAEQQLKTWRNSRRHNRTGLLPRGEEELARLQELQARQAKAHRLCEEAGRRLDELGREKALLQQELQIYADLHQETRYREYRDTQNDLQEAQREVEALRAELNRNGIAPDREQLRSAQEDLNVLNTLQANVRLAQRQLGEAEEAEQRAGAAAEDPVFGDMEPERAWEQAARDAAEADRKAGCGVMALLGGICLLGAAALLAAGAAALLQWLPAAGAAGGCALLGAVLLAVGLRRKKKVLGQRAALLERYQVQQPEEILRRADAYREHRALAAQAAGQTETIRQALDGLNRQRIELAGRLLKLVHTFEPEVTDGFGVSAALSRALHLWEKLSVAETRLEGAARLAAHVPQVEQVARRPAAEPRYDRAETAARLSSVEEEIGRLSSARALAMGERNSLGNPEELQFRCEQLREELTRRRGEYEALELALAGLERADSLLRERFSPLLNRRAGEIFSRLTGGRYQHVTLSRQFEAMGEEKGTIMPRKAIALSQGTSDQLYLAVRLAVCELALSEEQVPLVLDDALVSFDDERMALALDFLAQEAEHRQILLFTCQSRELQWAEGRRDVTVLNLQS